jgi:PAS domain S-box-containing protein
MTIRARITLLLSGLVLLASAVVFAQYLAEQQRTQSLLESVRTEREAAFSSIVEVSGSTLALFASDYSFWDEMIDFIEDPDPQFAEDNLVVGLDSFRADRVYVYDASGRNVYAYERGEDPSVLPPLPPEAFERVRASRLAHFFLIEDEEFIEYRMATVHPTLDVDRATEPHGFLLVGKKWDEVQVAAFENFSQSRILTQGEPVPPNGVIFPYAVYSWNGEIASEFNIFSPVPIVEESRAASEQQLYLVMGSFLFFLVLTYIFLETIVGKPLSILSRSIERKDYDRLRSLRKSTSEFGTLADIVLGFSEHELVLEGKAKDDAILSAIGSGVMAVDANGNVTLINKKAEQLLRVEAQAALGRPAASVFKAQTHACEPVEDADLPLLRALREKKVSTDTLMCTRTDGTRFPAIVTSAPVILDGAVIGAVQDFRDITSEEAIEKAKSDFISLVSHELRTPLTLLRWSIEKMEAMTAIQKQELDQLLAPMVSAIARMRTLVSSILDVSRIEMGAFAIGNAAVDLSLATKKVLDELAPHIEGKQLSVDVKLPPVSRTIYSDERLLQIIISSVLTNAIRYCDTGGKVTVALAEGEEAATLAIKNTGPGIPPEEQPKIFTKMFRASNARLLNPDGTGLGLYISRSFMERLGGTISFASTPNVETVFTITIPYGSAS